MPQEPEAAFFPSKEEQVKSYLILEDSDDQEHLSDDCSSLDFSDDELYDECLFSSPLPLGDSSSNKSGEDDADEEEDEDEDDDDDDEDDDDDDMDEDILMNTFFGDFYLEDDIQLYVPGDEGPSFVTNENVDMIRNLTSQLKNKREVNMLKLAAHADTAMLTTETSETTRTSNSSPDLKNAFYKDCAPFELPADFTPYAGVVPASINTPMGTSDESDSEGSNDEDEEEEDDDDADDADGTSSSDSSSEDDSDTSEILDDSDSDLQMKGSESDVDVEEVDILEVTNPRQNKRRFIEEEEDDDDDDSDGENLLIISQRLSLVRSVSAPVTPNPPRRGRPPQQQQQLQLPRSLRKTANNSPATSRASSRSSSPVPNPSPRNARKPTQLESSLIFKMRHLLPIDKRPDVSRFIEKATGSPFKVSFDADADVSEDLLAEFAPLAPSKLQEVSNFVQQCIQAKTAVEEETILRQESLKQEAVTPTKQEAPSVQEALKQETPPPSTPQPARQTRSRREAASSRSPSDSPLNNATPKPLPTSYVARPTSRTKSLGAAFKKQKADNGSDDEIDVLGF